MCVICGNVGSVTAGGGSLWNLVLLGAPLIVIVYYKVRSRISRKKIPPPNKNADES